MRTRARAAAPSLGSGSARGWRASPEAGRRPRLSRRTPAKRDAALLALKGQSRPRGPPQPAVHGRRATRGSTTSSGWPATTPGSASTSSSRSATTRARRAERRHRRRGSTTCAGSSGPSARSATSSACRSPTRSTSPSPPTPPTASTVNAVEALARGVPRPSTRRLPARLRPARDRLQLRVAIRRSRRRLLARGRRARRRPAAPGHRLGRRRRLPGHVRPASGVVNPGDAMLEAIAQVRECYMPMAGFGQRMPIHLEEFGYPTGPGRSESAQATALRGFVRTVNRYRGTYGRHQRQLVRPPRQQQRRPQLPVLLRPAPRRLHAQARLRRLPQADRPPRGGRLALRPRDAGMGGWERCR